MRRATLYSSSRAGPEKPVELRTKRKWPDLYTRHERRLLLCAAALLAVLATLPHLAGAPGPQAIPQQAIDAAVARALAERPLPSAATQAYEAVKGAIVQVRATDDALPLAERDQHSVHRRDERDDARGRRVDVVREAGGVHQRDGFEAFFARGRCSGLGGRTVAGSEEHGRGDGRRPEESALACSRVRRHGEGRELRA